MSGLKDSDKLSFQHRNQENKRTHRQHFNLSDHKWEDMVIVVTDRRTKYKENSWVEIIPLYSHDLAK